MDLLKLANLFCEASLKHNYFQKLNNLKEIDDYAKKNLTKIDSGSSRNAYIINSRKALKVAKPSTEQPGVEQNKAEKEMAEQFQKMNIDCYTKVYQHHPQYFWIIADLVRPIKDNTELANLLGVDTDTMFSLFAPPTFKRKPLPANVPQQLLQLKKLVDSGVLGRDIMKSNSWGKTADGQAVLLDYGMTGQVFKDYYSKSSTYEWEDEEDEDDK
jgi:hypothetical protein